MRHSTLQTLGLGTVLEIFQNGKLPVDTKDIVEKVFGNSNDRGSLVISGANGIVGAGKAMQLGSRLEPFGVTVVGLDFPGVPDGIREDSILDWLVLSEKKVLTRLCPTLFVFPTMVEICLLNLMILNLVSC